MAGRRTTRSVTSRGARNPTNWGGVVATALTAVPAATKVLLAVLVLVFVSGETIRRMRGTFYTKASEVSSYHGAIGAFVANDTAIAAGVASLLDPVTDVADDAWMWYQSFHGGGTATPGSAGDQAGQVWEVDSKAMRRVETGYSLVIVVANSTSAVDFSCALSFRALGSEAS